MSKKLWIFAALALPLRRYPGRVDLAARLRGARAAGRRLAPTVGGRGGTRGLASVLPSRQLAWGLPTVALSGHAVPRPATQLWAPPPPRVTHPSHRDE